MSTFCENIIANIIGGIFAGISVSIAMYFIFDKILIKRSKVKLYIEPNRLNLENENSEFELKFYLHNIGNSIAKNILFTANFPNLEVINFYKFTPLDKFRGGTPSIQYHLPESRGVLHPHPKHPRNTYIGKILSKLKKSKKEIKIEYDINAESMIFYNGIYKIRVNFKKEKSEALI